MTINYAIGAGVDGGFAAINPRHLTTLRIPCHFDAAPAA